MPQDPSQSPTGGPKSPQEPNFGRILEDFWFNFVRFLIDFGAQPQARWRGLPAWATGYISATVPSGTIVECSRVYVGSWDPWDPGIVVLEIPKGFLRGQQESGRLDPRGQISMIF